MEVQEAETTREASSPWCTTIRNPPLTLKKNCTVLSIHLGTELLSSMILPLTEGVGEAGATPEVEAARLAVATVAGT